MQLQIKVLDVSIINVPTSTSSYQKADVSYKDLGTGKTSNKIIMSFTEKDVYNIMSQAKSGEEYTITQEKKPAKDGKEYWTWISVVKGVSGVPVQEQKAGYASPKSNYETPEERQQRQDYIIRQSCLANAVNVLKTEKNLPAIPDVIGLAEQFVKWVYNKPLPNTDVPFDIEDDIPG